MESPAGEHPRALAAPPGATVSIDDALIATAIDASRQSPRRRIILPLHQKADEVLHRMLNAVQPGSYVRPHRHLAPPKAESLVLLRGSVRFFVFGETGEVAETFVLSAGSSQLGLDVRPGVYHTFVALAPDTVVFEVKPGPYEPTTDKDFAPWAPPEGTPEAAAYLASLASRTATRPPS